MTKVIPTIGTWQMACDLLDWNHIPEGKDRCAKQDAGALGRGMCKRIQCMDVLDNALEVRLPNDKPIDFLSVK